jgi:hypothetical protein
MGDFFTNSGTYNKKRVGLHFGRFFYNLRYIGATRNGSGYILGEFFTNSSGHPDRLPDGS